MTTPESPPGVSAEDGANYLRMAEVFENSWNWLMEGRRTGTLPSSVDMRDTAIILRRLAALALQGGEPAAMPAAELLSELLRGLEIPPSPLTSDPRALYEIGRAIAAQAKEAEPLPVPLSDERAALRSALERVTYNYRLTLSGKPVRDVAETLAEADAAMAQDDARADPPKERTPRDDDLIF